MAQLNSGNKSHFNSSIIININNDIIECKDKIKVYYTNIPFKKIEKASEQELQDFIEKSNLMIER